MSLALDPMEPNVSKAKMGGGVDLPFLFLMIMKMFQFPTSAYIIV